MGSFKHTYIQVTLIGPETIQGIPIGWMAKMAKPLVILSTDWAYIGLSQQPALAAAAAAATVTATSRAEAKAADADAAASASASTSNGKDSIAKAICDSDIKKSPAQKLAMSRFCDSGGESQTHRIARWPESRLYLTM